MGPERPIPTIPASELPLYEPEHVEEGSTVKLDANESPFPPPVQWREALEGRLENLFLNRYPDDASRELRTVLAEIHGLAPSNVHVGCGSNAILRDIFTAFGGPGRSALVFPPTYSGYARIARLTHTKCEVASRGSCWQISMEAVGNLERSSRSSLAVVCTPNNPTGISEEPAVIGALGQVAEVVIVDAAYGEFVRPSAPIEPSEDPPVVVVGTLSKAWALAGLRIGYCLGPEWLVAELRRNRLPYSVDALHEVAALTTLRFLPDLERRVDWIVSERERVASRLRAQDAVVLPSDANFLLFRPRAFDSDATWQGLRERSIRVRDCSGWPELRSWLRVSIGSEEENNRFLLALDEVLEEPPQVPAPRPGGED